MGVPRKIRRSIAKAKVNLMRVLVPTKRKFKVGKRVVRKSKKVFRKQVVRKTKRAKRSVRKVIKRLPRRVAKKLRKQVRRVRKAGRKIRPRVMRKRRINPVRKGAKIVKRVRRA